MIETIPARLMYRFPLVYNFCVSFITFPVLTKRYEIIPKLSGKTLEIGCGTGISTLVLKRKFKDLTCLDLNKHFLKYAKNKERVKNPVLGSGTFLPFKKGSFDNVIIPDAFHHIHNHDFLFKECQHVLKNKGNLIIFDPILIKNGKNKLINHFFDGVTWIFCTNGLLNHLKPLLKKYGFKIDLIKKNKTNILMHRFNRYDIVIQMSKIKI